MNRRNFLRLLGVGLVASPALARAAVKPAPQPVTSQIHDVIDALNGTDVEWRLNRSGEMDLYFVTRTRYARG